MRKRKSALPEANHLFDKVYGKKSNSAVISDLSKRVYLREAVVFCLTRIESRDEGINWWQDKELMSIFENLYKAGVLPLPADPVERIRWIAFLCMKTCEFDGFSYGNLLISLDYLPDEQLDDSYGVSVLTDIQNLREELKQKGWNAVFGW